MVRRLGKNCIVLVFWLLVWAALAKLVDRELLLPGAEVFLCASDNSARKTRYDLVAVRRGDGSIVNIDSQAPNAVVLEWLKTQGLSRIVPEYTWGSSFCAFFRSPSASHNVI